MQIDAHCHIDAYDKPYETAMSAERSRVLTIAVTNTPSAFEALCPHLQGFRYIRPALGLHPLLADRHEVERKRFARCVPKTSYIGEVGLDFSREGLPTREEQIVSFRFVLEQLRKQPKFISIHSRRAEEMVIDLVEEASITPVVFHWFSGSLTQLERLLANGHLCSINIAMVQSVRGQQTIAHLPRGRVLTETDGPYTKVSGRFSTPADVLLVEKFLAKLWGTSIEEVRNQLLTNLKTVVSGV